MPHAETLVPLRAAGVEVAARVTDLEDGAPELPGRPSNVVPFDRSRPRLSAEPPEGLTYREALPEIDRRAKESGSEAEWFTLGVVYRELRALKLADNQVLREEWLNEHVWKAHTNYWGTRQRAAYEAGFAAGVRVLRGDLGPRLMDHREAPPSAETMRERFDREQREKVQRIREGNHPTGETRIDTIISPKKAARFEAAGMVTLADVAARMESVDGWAWKESDRRVPVPAYCDGRQIEPWLRAAGLVAENITLNFRSLRKDGTRPTDWFPVRGETVGGKA